MTARSYRADTDTVVIRGKNVRQRKYRGLRSERVPVGWLTETIVRENKAKNIKSHVLDFERNAKNAKNVKVMTREVLETTQSVFVL